MPFRFSTFASICTHKFLIIPLKGKRVERLMGAHNIFYSSFILMHRFTTHHHRLLRSDDDTCYVHFLSLSWLTKSSNLLSCKKSNFANVLKLMKNFFSFLFRVKIMRMYMENSSNSYLFVWLFTLSLFFTSSFLRACMCIVFYF